MAAASGKRKWKEDKEGGIAYILKPLNRFRHYFSSSAPTPSPINVSKKFDLLKVNDYVYELCKPSGRPSVEIVFFHGFQLGGSSQTYATTWLSRNGSELWPIWIRKSVPEVRILLVSYDGSATKKDDRGSTDMYVTSENLVQSLTSAHVGQDGCPVILVGHSLGGLVIKEILLQANKVLSLDKPKNPNLRVQSFLENVKQLFYYSCPHHGTRLADKAVPEKGQLFKLLKTLNKKAARRNEEFRKLRDKFEWGANSIAEKLPADLGSLGKQVVVEEASARNDTEGYYTADADHFSVCQPASDTDSSFSTLRDIIDCTRREVVPGHQIKIPTTLVGLNDQITEVTLRLRTTHLSICGIGGIGKSTLAMAVYNAISGNFEYTSFVSEVKKKVVGEQVSTENLQEEILKNLYYKGNKSEHKWDRLKGKRVLIILDDVEYESQIFVMPEKDRGGRFFSDESRVLVTSRYRKIVSSKGFPVLDAQVLGDEDSRELFCCHAFKEKHAPGPYKHHVEKFIEKCGGLPLALELVGKYLNKQENEDMWNGAYQRLRAAQSLGGSKKDPLWSIFEVIYQDLEEEEQQMFLDIATCFHGEEMEMANLVWRCCDWGTSAVVGWQNLVDVGFVRADFQDIWMHELLLDFGWRKYRNLGSIESYSRVCCSQESDKPPPWPFKEGTTPRVKFLKIAVDDDLPIDMERLHRLENLKVLWLDGVKVHGAFNLLPNNLEVLIMRERWWTARSSKSVSDTEDRYNISRDIERLRGLESLKVLWLDGVSVHGAFNLLPDNLEVLRMRECWWTARSSSAPKSGQHVSLQNGVRRHQIETPTTFFGLNDQITEVTTRLRTTQHLSICGTGGVGKSTLAMVVYNDISGNFEYTSFVSEVKKKLVGEQVSTENLQAEILKNLYYKGNKSKHKWDRLKGKRVLIILDDVEYESQLFVMPKTDKGDSFFSDESRVLATCRNRRIVFSKDFEVHDARFLSNEASRKLFCYHAFKEQFPPLPFKDHVEKIIANCAGSPLALEVAGKYLYVKEKDNDVWSAFQRLSAAKQLGGRREDALWSIFEVIYKDLRKKDQQMFLDIATCFHGDTNKMATLVWHCCDWVNNPTVGWQNLVDIGFARLSDFGTRIWMHEFLRDFGRTKANPGSIESHSRVCCSQESDKPPPWPFKEGTTPLVKFLKIAVYDDLPIDIERLHGLENLKVLWLDGVTLYGAFNLLPDHLEVLIMRKCGWTARSSRRVSNAVNDYYISTDGWCSTLGVCSKIGAT